MKYTKERSFLWNPGKALSGILITVFGFISAIVSLGLKGRISRTKRGFILSQLQLIIIIVAASANNTTALITRSIEAVDKGTKLAYNVADKMKGAIEISRESAEYAHRITVIANEQTEYVSAASGKMGNITRVVNQSRF